jgi:biopolymer transport protein ExbD
MSDIAQDGGGGKKKGGKIRSKKTSTRIDMTPMVDLAFLLLTFFILTTTLQKPQAMQVTMPEKDEKEPPKVNEKHVLTLIMGPSDKVFYYMGITDPEVLVTNFSKDGVRKLLLSKKAQIPKLIVLIKSMDESKYKNMVDILDEMNINNIERFAIVDVTTTDKDLIKDSHL